MYTYNDIAESFVFMTSISQILDPQQVMLVKDWFCEDVGSSVGVSFGICDVY